MKAALKTIIGATAACAIFGAPNVAQAQGTSQGGRVFAELETPSAVSTATTEIRRTAEDARTAQTAGNCTRLGILRSRLWEIRQNPKHPFWKRHGLDGPTAPGGIVTGVNKSLNDTVAQLNALECPPKTAAAQGQIGASVSAGGGVAQTRAPQVSGGTMIVGGAERAIIDSVRRLTGEFFSFSAQLQTRGGSPFPALTSPGPPWDDTEIEVSGSRVDGNTQGGVPIGSSSVAQTYIFPNPSSGSTGIAAGTTGQSVSIATRQQKIDVLYNFLFRDPFTLFVTLGDNTKLANAEGRIVYPASPSLYIAFGLRYRNLDTEHTIGQQSLTFPGLNSSIDLDTNSHFIGLNLGAGVNFMPPPGGSGLIAGISGFVAPGVLITDARASQTSRCDPCGAASPEFRVSLGRDFSDTSFTAIAGFKGHVGYQPSSSVKLLIEGRVEHTTRVDTFAVPITPTQQPIRLDNDSSTSAYVGARAVFAFSPGRP